MSKLATIGVSGLGQARPQPSQKTLFQTWPKDELVPYGNPAYEGVGYPAAGYGQVRRKVVRLAQPKVNGEPVMTRLVANDLNPKSDEYTRTQIAVLAGLGCNCSSVDRRFSGNLRGLAAAEQSTMQSLADAIVRGAVPASFVQKLADKIITDERENARAYRAVQELKRLKQPFAAAEKQQQEAWGETNTAKFYALLIPEMQKHLGFTDGKPQVSAPDYAYIKQARGGGVFAKVAQVVQDTVTGTAANNLLAAGFMKDSSLKGLGIAWVPISIAAAVIVAAAVYAYLQSTSPATAAAASVRELTNAYTTGRISKAEYATAMAAVEKAASTIGSGASGDIKDIVTYGAIGVGAIVILNIIGSLRSALPSR